VLLEGDDGCGKRLRVRQRREAPGLLGGGHSGALLSEYLRE
jgi:hypothetical protein